MKRFLNENKDNLKFNFLLRGQLGKLIIDNFFLTASKMLPRYEYFFLVPLFLHLLLKRSVEIILIRSGQTYVHRNANCSSPQVC